MVPGIEWHVESRVISGRRAFREIQLAEHHGACRPQPRDHSRIEGRNEIPQHRRPAHGAHALRVAQVLYPDRYTMERATIPAGLNFFLSRPRVGKRLLAHDRGIAFQDRVDLRDAVEHVLRELHRR